MQEYKGEVTQEHVPLFSEVWNTHTFLCNIWPLICSHRATGPSQRPIPGRLCCFWRIRAWPWTGRMGWLAARWFWPPMAEDSRTAPLSWRRRPGGSRCKLKITDLVCMRHKPAWDHLCKLWKQQLSVIYKNLFTKLYIHCSLNRIKN